MAITLETIEKVNIESVLRAAEQRVKAEAALSRAAKARGIDERQLAKAIDDTARAEKETLAAAERAGKAWRATEDLKQKEINQTVDAELRAAAAAEKLAAAEAKRNAVAKQRADAKAYLFNVRAASEEMDKATVSTGAMAAATGNLRSQLIDIGVGLQGGQNPFTIMSQQGPQIAEVFMNNTALAAKFAAVLPTIGVAAAAAAAVGAPLLGWYYELGIENEKLIELSGKTAKAMDRLAEGVDKIVEAQADLDVREGILSGAVSETQAKEIKAQAEATEIYADAIGGLKEKLGALQTELDRVEGPQGILATLFGPGAAERANKAKALRAQIDGTKEDIKEFNDEQATFVKRTVDVETAEDKAATAAKKRTKAVDDGTASLRAYVTAIEDLQSVSGGAKDKPDANDDPTIRLLRQQVAEAKSAAAEITGLTAREANDRAAAVIEAEYKLSMQVQAIEAQAADESAQAAARSALRVVDEKLRIADEAARATLATDEELNELLAENARIAAEERAQIDAELDETIKNNYLDLMSKKWEADQAYINKRRDAEIRAAEASKAAWRSFASGTQTMLGNLASFTESAADEIGKTNEDAALRAYKITRAIKVVEATMGAYRIGEEFFEAAAKINPLLGPPAFAVGFGLAETAAVIPIRQQEPPSFNDTPSVQKMTGNRGLVSFAEGDYFAAAKDPEKLKQQVDKMQGGAKSEQVYGSLQPARFNDTPGVQRMGREQQAGGNLTISIPMKVNNRTAQNIVVQARASKVGYQIGQPIAGRRARKIGAR